MRILKINKDMIVKGTLLTGRENGMISLVMRDSGSGIDISSMNAGSEKYLSFYVKCNEMHSVILALRFFTNETNSEPDFMVRVTLLPGVLTPVCIERSLLDAQTAFPEARAGGLKMVCSGKWIEKEEIRKITLENVKVFHDIKIEISDLRLTDDYPEFEPLPDVKLVDELGQFKLKDWNGKISSVSRMKEILEEMETMAENGFPFADWSELGSWKKKKLQEGTGFFTRCKSEGRWWLVDPDGYAFFSVGSDCVRVGADCRVDGVEKWMDWLPEQTDPVFGKMFWKPAVSDPKKEGSREKTMFSFTKANLYRAFGENWYQRWQKMICGQLRSFGMNTLGNWSDSQLFGTTGMAYVTSLERFPQTTKKIFRDFPDVFDEEYEQQAGECAKTLEERKNDPFMIGYFLRNEPGWAYINNLVLADEVLYNPERTACKEALITFLKNKYTDIQSLNKAYHKEFDSFEQFYQPQKKVSTWTEASMQDMKEFSKKMLERYVEVPCKACRSVDSNHMILGMRWAWISDSALVTGWENFDVFSINCYAENPTENVQRVVELGVDLPVMIGEFHFGALDAGPTSTGLRAVRTQKDRGIAYRYYCEHAAMHPYIVGCHYFECYDEFVLGRFDGENYNIGLFDICSCPYPDMMNQVKESSRRLYQIADGTIPATEENTERIPMIAC